MRTLLRFLSAIPLALSLPVCAYAQTIAADTATTTVSVSEVVGLFNILVGVMFVAAVVAFVGGLILYILYFGNYERGEGVTMMEWGVSILFVLVVLLGTVQFLQIHTGVTNVIAALVVIGVVLWVAFIIITEEPKKEEKKP